MKILAIDIETSPNKVYTWGFWDQNVGLNQVIDQTRMLCFAAKWLGKGGVEFRSEFHDSTETMVERAWELLDEADVVIHYNGKRFDIPHLQREFLEHGFPPPSPFDQIDLLAVVRSTFKYPSNRLENISRQLGLEGKVAHEGFDLWVKCMAGEASAWRKMRKYNKRDVTLLEDLYEMLQPWIRNHPSRNLHTGLDGCPRCGADADWLVKRGVRRTAVSVFQQYRCSSCGGYVRDTKRIDNTTRRSV